MKKIISITDLPHLEKGTFVIVYEGLKAIDSGVITETQESQGLIVFKSASKKEDPMPLMWNSNYSGWSPSFEDPMTDKMVFSQRGACYGIKEDERRIPLVLS